MSLIKSFTPFSYALQCDPLSIPGASFSSGPCWVRKTPDCPFVTSLVAVLANLKAILDIPISGFSLPQFPLPLPYATTLWHPLALSVMFGTTYMIAGLVH